MICDSSLVWDWWMRFTPATGSAATDVKLQELGEYSARTWVHGDYPPELWTHYDNNGPRTTNAAEGWHNCLNTHFGTPHPCLRVFLHWLLGFKVLFFLHFSGFNVISPAQCNNEDEIRTKTLGREAIYEFVHYIKTQRHISQCF